MREHSCSMGGRKGAALVSVLAAAVALNGCVSARPRPHVPELSQAVRDQAAFDSEFAACATDVAAGRRNFEGGAAPIVAAGVGGVAATSVLGGAATGATTVGAGGGLAATGAGILLLIPLATYKLSTDRRRRNEQEVQKAMSACLAQRGFAVSGWRRLPSHGVAAMTTPTKSGQSFQ